MTDDLRHEYRRFLSDHPGHPLGPGMPLGRALREEVFDPARQMWRGESHLMAWERITRGDPCAYCGEMIHYSQREKAWMLGAGTVDHIEPKTLPVHGLGGAHSWLNLTAACGACNGAKGRKDLLHFLRVRAMSRKVAQKSNVLTSGQLSRAA